MLENDLKCSRHLGVSLGVGVLEMSRRFDNVRECSRKFEIFGSYFGCQSYRNV